MRTNYKPIQAKYRNTQIEILCTIDALTFFGGAILNLNGLL